MTHEIDPFDETVDQDALIARAVRINAARVRLTPQRMGFQTLVWVRRDGGRGSEIEANQRMLERLYDAVGADAAAAVTEVRRIGEKVRREQVTPVALTEETTVYIREVQTVQGDGWHGAKLTCSIRGPEDL